MKLRQSITATFLGFPYAVYAAGTLTNPTPGGGVTLQDFIYLLIEIVQMVGIPMLVVAIIYAGFLLMTAGDNETQRTKGKKWIVWVVVGAVIVLGAQVLADMVYTTAGAF